MLGLHTPMCQIIWSRTGVPVSINFKRSRTVPIMKTGLKTTGLFRLDDLQSPFQLMFEYSNVTIFLTCHT